MLPSHNHTAQLVLHMYKYFLKHCSLYSLSELVCGVICASDVVKSSRRVRVYSASRARTASRTRLHWSPTVSRVVADRIDTAQYCPVSAWISGVIRLLLP